MKSTLRTITYELIKIGVVVGLILLSNEVKAQMPSGLRGCWQIEEVLETSNVQALTAQQARALLGRRVRFSVSRFVSGEVTVLSPRYVQKRWSVSEFVDGYRVFPKDVGLNRTFISEVTVCREHRVTAGAADDVVLVRDDIAGALGDTVLVKNEKTLIFV